MFLFLLINDRQHYTYDNVSHRNATATFVNIETLGSHLDEKNIEQGLLFEINLIQLNVQPLYTFAVDVTKLSESMEKRERERDDIRWQNE